VLSTASATRNSRSAYLGLRSAPDLGGRLGNFEAEEKKPVEASTLCDVRFAPVEEEEEEFDCT
jgi:hypothetical protein